MASITERVQMSCSVFFFHLLRHRETFDSHHELLNLSIKPQPQPLTSINQVYSCGIQKDTSALGLCCQTLWKTQSKTRFGWAPHGRAIEQCMCRSGVYPRLTHDCLPCGTQRTRSLRHRHRERAHRGRHRRKGLCPSRTGIRSPRRTYAGNMQGTAWSSIIWKTVWRPVGKKKAKRPPLAPRKNTW